MRTITKTFNIYHFNELDRNAKDRVRDWYLSLRDTWEFTSICDGVLGWEFPNSKLSVDYSLGYCQSDYMNLRGTLDIWDMYEKFKEEFTEKEQRFLRWVLEEFTSNYQFRVSNWSYRSRYSEDDILDDIRDDLLVGRYKNVRWNTLEKFGKKAKECICVTCQECMEDGYKFFYEIDDEDLGDWCEDHEFEFYEDGEVA